MPKMGWVLTDQGGTGAQRAMILEALEKGKSITEGDVEVICRGPSRTVKINGRAIGCAYREIRDFS